VPQLQCTATATSVLHCCSSPGSCYCSPHSSSTDTLNSSLLAKQGLPKVLQLHCTVTAATAATAGGLAGAVKATPLAALRYQYCQLTDSRYCSPHSSSTETLTSCLLAKQGLPMVTQLPLLPLS
jgi:hypothetical protein